MINVFGFILMVFKWNCFLVRGIGKGFLIVVVIVIFWFIDIFDVDVCNEEVM